MKDSTHIKRAPHDTEQHLLQKEQLSDSENCLKTMKQIAALIEAVSTLSTLSLGPCSSAAYSPLPSYLLAFNLLLYRVRLHS